MAEFPELVAWGDKPVPLNKIAEYFDNLEITQADINKKAFQKLCNTLTPDMPKEANLEDNTANTGDTDISAVATQGPIVAATANQPINPPNVIQSKPSMQFVNFTDNINKAASGVRKEAKLSAKATSNIAGAGAGIATAIGTYLLSGLWDEKNEHRGKRALLGLGLGTGVGLGVKFGGEKLLNWLEKKKAAPKKAEEKKKSPKQVEVKKIEKDRDPTPEELQQLAEDSVHESEAEQWRLIRERASKLHQAVKDQEDAAKRAGEDLDVVPKKRNKALVEHDSKVKERITKADNDLKKAHEAWLFEGGFEGRDSAKINRVYNALWPLAGGAVKQTTTHSGYTSFSVDPAKLSERVLKRLAEISDDGYHHTSELNKVIAGRDKYKSEVAKLQEEAAKGRRAIRKQYPTTDREELNDMIKTFGAGNLFSVDQ